MTKLDELKNALDAYLAHAEAIESPYEAAVAVERGWDALQETSKRYSEARVVAARKLIVSPSQANPDKVMTQKELSDLLGVTISVANMLVRGGSKAMPRYNKRPPVTTKR